MAEQKNKFGIDYDGVVVKKYPKYNPRNWVKGSRGLFGLPLLPGAKEGLTYLTQQSDSEILGFYTIRPESARGNTTRKQIEREGLPVERVVHTASSYRDKIVALLLDAVEADSPALRMGGSVLRSYLRLSGARRIVLVDDNETKVVQAAQQLHDEYPSFHPLLERFVLASFNPRHTNSLEGTIITGVVHVVRIQSWAEAPSMLEEVRSL